MHRLLQPRPLIFQLATNGASPQLSDGETDVRTSLEKAPPTTTRPPTHPVASFAHEIWAILLCRQCRVSRPTDANGNSAIHLRPAYRFARWRYRSTKYRDIGFCREWLIRPLGRLYSATEPQLYGAHPKWKPRQNSMRYSFNFRYVCRVDSATRGFRTINRYSGSRSGYC